MLGVFVPPESVCHRVTSGMGHKGLQIILFGNKGYKDLGQKG